LFCACNISWPLTYTSEHTLVYMEPGKDYFACLCAKLCAHKFVSSSVAAVVLIRFTRGARWKMALTDMQGRRMREQWQVATDGRPTWPKYFTV